MGGTSAAGTHVAHGTNGTQCLAPKQIEQNIQCQTVVSRFSRVESNGAGVLWAWKKRIGLWNSTGTEWTSDGSNFEPMNKSLRASLNTRHDNTGPIERMVASLHAWKHVLHAHKRTRMAQKACLDAFVFSHLGCTRPRAAGNRSDAWTNRKVFLQDRQEMQGLCPRMVLVTAWTASVASSVSVVLVVFTHLKSKSYDLGNWWRRCRFRQHVKDPKMQILDSCFLLFSLFSFFHSHQIAQHSKRQAATHIIVMQQTSTSTTRVWHDDIFGGHKVNG